MFLTKFVRKDGKPDEEYYYHSASEATDHLSLFLDDDSNLYGSIVASDEKENKVLQILLFDTQGKATSFKDGDVVRFCPEYCSEGERKYIFAITNMNDRTMRCTISCLNSSLVLGSSETVGFEMIQQVGTTIEEILASAKKSASKEEEGAMTYQEYLKFYGLQESKETHDDWLYNEWHLGRAYQFEGEFYRMGTNEKLSAFNGQPNKGAFDMNALQINRGKLKQYLEDEMIMEFSSAEECMEYFNTYDGQNFKSVDEMKAYQVQYGFGLDGKWYHISFDEALDVWEKPALTTQIQNATEKVANNTCNTASSKAPPER